MATDVNLILKNLCDFYNFTGKTVLSVGAGGGQLVTFGRRAKKVLAVDQDLLAIRQLEARLQELDFKDRFELIHADFMEVSMKADVVLFEFSLHEMPDVLAAIEHARSLAPEVVAIDHAPDSQWAYFVCEEALVSNSYKAMADARVREQKLFDTQQVFKNHDELFAKVAIQGPLAIERISRFREQNEIIIPMRYGATLL